MSAISLVWNFTGAWQASESHAGMLAALEQYGPHYRFQWSDDRIGLGTNLFSSVPEESFDLQPVWHQDRSCCVVADVRLDNRAELARELELSDHARLADSSFVLHAWLRWGPDCLDHLLGGFAFAVWMPREEIVFAARDHAGERPLFYTFDKLRFALASMPKGLLALPDFDPALREEYIAGWLGCLKPEWAATFFQNVQRLPPGHYLRASPAGVETVQYWDPAKAKPTRFRRDEEYAEALLELFDRATAARLRSRKPVGSFLSGGLDSSSVAASAAGLLAGQGKNLIAYTSVPRPGFTGQQRKGFFADEAQAAAEVAERYRNIEHVIINSTGYDLLATMKRWDDAMDEPAPSVINMLWLSAIFDDAKRRGLGVLLDGSEGNATFSYNNWSVLRRFLLGGRWLTLARTTNALQRKQALQFSSAVRCMAGPLVPRWLTRMRVPTETLNTLCACLASAEYMKSHDLKRRIFDAFYPAPAGLRQEHAAMFYGQDQGPYRAAVQAVTQMEVRDPTADKRIYEFCYSIPEEQFLAGGMPRSLARRAMRDRLPASVLKSQLRGLQGADWYSIMAESLPDLRREAGEIAKAPAACRALDLPAMEALLNRWPQSGFHEEDVYTRWHFWLTRAITLGYFLRTHDPERPGSLNDAW